MKPLGGRPRKTEGEECAAEVVLAYHERTKHHPHRYAASLGYLDWETQPNPFRRFAGAELVRLPLPSSGRPLPFGRVYSVNAVPVEALSIDTLSLFFRYALSLTAWKRFRGTTWSLRANPSSGNLHPTEGYAILPALERLGDTAGVYHYAPREHALERRAALETQLWGEISAPFPQDSFFVALSSILWREAWKYGERAFRYCQHDVGHALGSLRIAAAALGWKAVILEGVRDDVISNLLGLDRNEDFGEAEREEPELLAVISPSAAETLPRRLEDIKADATAARWTGRANKLSPEHGVEWPVIEEVARATIRSEPATIIEDLSGLPAPEELFESRVPHERLTAEAAILGRRSAVAMDGATAISRSTFIHMLSRLMPARDRRSIPWDAIPWRPRIHLGLFVHRVDGLAPGVYMLARDPARLPKLQALMRREFLWQRVTDSALPLYLLQAGDYKTLAADISCGQDIAGAGAFSLGMIADYRDALNTYGPAFYRNLFWEAGMVGQVLYLEAEEAGVRATGIGCYFDDLVHETFGLTTREWQSFYHFTVGGPIEDTRLTTLPAYPNV